MIAQSFIFNLFVVYTSSYTTKVVYKQEGESIPKWVKGWFQGKVAHFLHRNPIFT
jgi:hypothetical protein